ncbi:TfoX/Sxy family protein [Wenzhouxiangella sp. XN79A]|uniref:TfoX/Sxy family protein n=1 Tax=Wenzhouxiangella sp. XN79A TaxID=2724193 RepID=UPI0019824078
MRDDRVLGHRSPRCPGGHRTRFHRHLLDAAGLAERLTARAMFGEYGVHFEGGFIALACRGSCFIKAAPALERHGPDLPMRPPYPGAKPYPVADELLDETETLRQLLIDTAAELPPPKSKKPRSKAAMTRSR